jgi:hypothetical protein
MMKQRIDLEKAADAEAFGALAGDANHKHRTSAGDGRRFTPAQNRALSEGVRVFDANTSKSID